MRYEDTSGSFSTPDARDDADILQAGDHGPATGNVITGAGTTSGKSGADIAAGGHVVAVRGAGGTDASDSGSSLHVEGRYGVLTLDASGNYRYTPNQGVPDNVRDLFQYTLANNNARDTADLVIELGGGAIKVDANAQRLVPGADGIITLPPGVDLTDVHVVGRDLVVTLPNGQQIVIVDGAVFVPQLVIGGVEVPASNVAELLIDSEVKPTAGPPQSSGGNFADPLSPLDPGTPLGDLIPPTVLAFTPPDIKELATAINHHPETGPNPLVQLDDDALLHGIAGGVGDDPDGVNTSGLLSGSGGDGNLTWALLASGAPAGFSYVAGPGGSILVQQVQGGNTVTVLTITVNPSTGAYTVTQNAAIIHPAGGDENNVQFAINYTVTDHDGDKAPGVLTINVDDDTPTVSVTAGPDAAIILTTHDALTIGAASETVSTSANFSGVFSGTTVNFGADGAGVGSSSGYSLSTTGGVSGLTQSGVAINLFNVSGTIVGSTATSAGGITAANTVFSVSVSATGVVTLTQFSQIDHTNADPSPTGAPFDDQFISLADGAITLTRTETATDKDGDTATGSASVAIGANLHFVDDGPSISASTTHATLTVDETILATNATASFAGVFSATFGADGPAASASITYALGINAGATGLIDTATGAAVVLSVVGGQVVGTAGAGGPVVFTVSVDAAGNVTLDQVRAVVHTVSSNPDSSEPAATIPDNLVTLTATAHDFDGDTAAATANIGSSLVFLDDGPSISASSTQPTLTVDETVLATNATASFASVFTSSFGADGAGTIAYALGINGTATGLTDSLTGEAVVLSVVSGHVEGRTATTNQLVFTVSVAANGDVTLDQVRAVIHSTGSDPDTSEPATLSLDNAVTLTATITDKDGDSASAVANIGQNLSFLDDGPTITASTTQPTLTVDESNFAIDASVSFAGVFTAAFGADGPAAAGATAYTLGINAGSTGLTDSLTGEAVVLSVVGGHVEGRTATTNQLVFTVSVDASGNVTLDQSRAVIHTVGSDPDTSEPATLAADNLITLTASVTDKDGDHASATANIGQNLSFLDDGPSITARGEEPLLTVDETNFAVNATANFAANFNALFGSDGPAAANSTTYALGLNGTATGLVDSLTGEAVVLSVNGSGQVEGRTATTNLLVFTVSVAANGDVTLDQDRAVIHTLGSDPDTSEGKTLSADNAITLTATVTDKDGDSAHATINIGQNLNFLDDGPTISASGTEASLTVDETNFAVNDTQSFASAFTSNFGHDGPAAANSTTYALSINAGATGLLDSLTGEAVVLVNNAGVIEGRTATTNLLVFTVSVAANGDVTLDQSRAVIHTLGTDPDSSESRSLAADNLIVLTATITDKDGDQAHASVNIGQNLFLQDDGPTIVASGTEATLTVDETNFAINDTQSFASAFTANFGHDGAALVNPTTYALGLNAGSTGLVDTLTGEAVVLVNNGGVIEGRTATTNLLVFTVSVAANGDVTLDQSRAVVHTTSSSPDSSEAAAAIPDNLITLTATVTDKDGDHAHATINIGSNLNFLDDGPTATNDTDNVGSGLSTATGNVITGVDFIGGDANATDGNADNPGHDGFGGVLQIHSNGTSTTDTTFSAGLLSVTGSYGTLTMDANGNYTYTKTGSPGNVSDVFTYTYQDKDGDTATATLTISITDSTPTANGISVVIDDDDVVGAGGNPGTPAVNDDAPSNTSGTLTSSGGDGAISYFFSASQTLPSGFTSSLTTLAGVQTLQISQNGTLVMTVTLTNATGAYSVVENHAIDHSTGNLENNLGINVSFFAQDVDGSQSAPATMAISVDDDTPVVGLSTAQEPTLTTDETTLPANAGPTSFAGMFTQSYGADGPAAAGSSTYALGINAGVTGLVDSLTGEAVVLSVNGSGQVEGRTTTTNLLVFTVSVDGSGNVSLTQSRAVIHGTATDPDGSEPKSLAADNLVTLTHTITDHDGDSASATANIGQNLIFLDDGPTISASGTEATLTVDETNFLVNDTQSFASAFTKSFGNDGQAAANSTTYALSINAGSTGLVDSLTGEAVVLVNNAGVIEGRTATTNLLVFTVSVAANGDVTLDQSRAVIHTLGTDPDTSEGKSLAADNLIVLTATVTDKDGDQAHASVNIGQNINFNDDGPTISGGGTEPTVTVDETNLGTVDTKNFASAFTVDFGHDGQASVNPNVYTLGIGAGSTGLIDSLTGEAVVLSVVSGHIEGRTATTNQLVFTVTVASNGDVTLNQARAVIHSTGSNPDTSEAAAAMTDSLITLTRTVTDKDGDSAHATINIGANLQFLDDGPTVTGPAANSSVSVDETNAANAGFSVAVGGGFPISNTSAAAMITATTAFGNDGPAVSGGITYAITIVGGGATTLKTAVGDYAITLVQTDAQTITGQYNDGSVKTAFTVHINANGTVTLTENVPLEHNTDGGTPAEYNDTLSLSGLINATVTVTDKDGDSATSAPVGIGGNITFFDDGPHAFTPDGVASLNGDNAAVTGNLNVNMGADGLGSFTFSGVDGTNAIDAAGHLLKVGGVQLQLFGFGTNHIYAATSAGGAHAYDVTLNADGTYSFDVNAAVDNGTQTSFTNLTSGAAGNVLVRTIGVDAPANNPSNTDIIFSGHSADGTTQGTINTNASAVGVDNQSTNPGEGVRIDFVKNLTTNVTADPTDLDLAWTNHVTTTHFEQLVPQVQGSPSNTVNIVVTAILADEDQTLDFTPANGIETGESIAIITKVTVNDVSTGQVDVLVDPTGNNDGIATIVVVNSITVVFLGNGQVVIEGIQAGDTYGIDTATPFSAVVAESPSATLYPTYINTNGFDLGIFSIGSTSAGTPIDQNFTVVATDSDGDFATSTLHTTIVPVATGNSVGDATGNTITGDAGDNTIAGNAGNDTISGGDGNDYLYGGAGNDTLNGGNGNDTLVGDTGADIMTGGAGNDTFVLSNAAITNGAGNVDTITDYATGDIVDITQILSVAAGTDVIAGGYLRVTTTGLVQVDLNGGGDGWVTLSNINTGVNPVTVRYVSGGAATNVAVTPVIPPIALDLNNDGHVDFLSSAAGVTFDYGSGKVATAWVGPQDGMLVRDANHDGQISANEMSFSIGGTDLQGLAAYDTNHDGQLSSADADWASFSVWQDANSNGVVDPGEMTSLTARGIASISLSSNGIAYSAAGGDVQVAGTGSFTYANGSTGALADAAFATGARTEAARTIAANDGNATILAAAVAAAGLAAGAANAAPTHTSEDANSNSASGAPVHNEALAPVALDATSSAPGSSFVEHGTVTAEAASAAAGPSHASDQGQSSSAASSAAAQAPAPTALLSGTDAPVHDAVVSATPVTAASVGMPAPTASAAGDSAGAHNAVVAQVLVDALHGGDGGTIDGLIASLPDHGGGSAAQVLASIDTGGVSNGDSVVHAGFVAMQMGLGMDAMVVHQDAVPTHA